MTTHHTAYFVQMACNNAWANETLSAAMRGISAEGFTAPRPGFFGSLSKTLNHIYEVDLYYLDALTQGGLGRGVFKRTDIEDPTALAQAQAKVDAALIAFTQSLNDNMLNDTRTTERKDGSVSERVSDLLLHLTQHQIHHRGQAHTQLHHAGIAPPQLDDFYLEYGRVSAAARYWEDMS